MQGINQAIPSAKVIFMVTPKPTIKASPRLIARSVSKRFPLVRTPAKDGIQGMTALSFPFGDIGQERFLTEILRYVTLVSWMAATLDKGLSGELA
jgi:hypothetical protein